MKKLTRVLDDLFTAQLAGSDFPIVVPALAVMGKSNRSGVEKIIISPTEEKTQESDEGGSLLPPRQLHSAHSLTLPPCSRGVSFCQSLTVHLLCVRVLCRQQACLLDRMPSPFTSPLSD